MKERSPNPVERRAQPLFTVREDPPRYGRPRDRADDSFEDFLRYLRTVESEPRSTLARQLIREGIELPPPETFTEANVHAKLWEVIRSLARHRHFLSSTDHLSDLELYRHLWEFTLNEPTHDWDNLEVPCGCCIDLISDGSDEAIWHWLRYYASPAERSRWAREFPGDPLPGPLSPPYDRDRHLPAPGDSPSGGRYG